MDRAGGRLTINALHAEPGMPQTKQLGRTVARAITDLGDFLGAREISYGEAVPAGWAKGL